MPQIAGLAEALANEREAVRQRDRVAARLSQLQVLLSQADEARDALVMAATRQDVDLAQVSLGEADRNALGAAVALFSEALPIAKRRLEHAGCDVASTLRKSLAVRATEAQAKLDEIMALIRHAPAAEVGRLARQRVEAERDVKSLSNQAAASMPDDRLRSMHAAEITAAF